MTVHFKHGTELTLPEYFITQCQPESNTSSLFAYMAKNRHSEQFCKRSDQPQSSAQGKTMLLSHKTTVKQSSGRLN